MSCRRIQPVSPQEPLVKQAGKCGRSADFGEVVMQRSSFLRSGGVCDGDGGKSTRLCLSQS